MIDPDAILAANPAAVPRYTSYPTAPHFSADAGPDLVEAMLAEAAMAGRISLYVHIPFCDRLCWFCACHTKQTHRYEPVAAYVDSLIREIGLYRDRLPTRPCLGHLHLGGGSPSLLRADDFRRLRAALDTAFQIDRRTEISIEIDPNDHRDDLMDGLRALGVTRVSIGVQDFDPQVQAIINRPQSFEQTRDLLEAVRALGIASVNIDALYGLPKQSLPRLEATLRQVIGMRPDRIALFGYAHVPWVKKHQGMIDARDLPDAVERFRQAERAATLLKAAGYRAIGIDHFALPRDGLTKAAEQGRLHRNFQGYTTDDCSVMLPLGASSIGRFSDGYLQNLVPTGQYRMAVDKGDLALARGCRLSADDRLRGWVIERIMCDFGFRFADLRRLFGQNGEALIGEAARIALTGRDGLCALDDDGFHVPAEARAFTRIVASRFDAYLGDGEVRYSRAV